MQQLGGVPPEGDINKPNDAKLLPGSPQKYQLSVMDAAATHGSLLLCVLSALESVKHSRTRDGAATEMLTCEWNEKGEAAPE